MENLYIKLFVLLISVDILLCEAYQADESFNVAKVVKFYNNIPGLSWKAGRNGFGKIVRLSQLKKNLGWIPKQKKTIYKASPASGEGEADANDLPKSFDCRVAYPHCTTIRSIKDQSNCGSCWAVSVASAFSDRLCIHSNGKVNANMSADQLLACDKKSDGCNGAEDLKTAWQYIADEGLGTGGDYGSNEGCRPYSIPPNRSFFAPSPKTPECGTNNCPETYKVRTGTVGSVQSMEYLIRKEIYKNGPITTGFYVYLSFKFYNSGIYSRPFFDFIPLGGHAVRVIGWGEEDGIKYWLVANSWGKKWGEEGTFRIRRGTDECGFESSMAVAALPDTTSIYKCTGIKMVKLYSTLFTLLVTVNILICTAFLHDGIVNVAKAVHFFNKIPGLLWKAETNKLGEFVKLSHLRRDLGWIPRRRLTNFIKSKLHEGPDNYEDDLPKNYDCREGYPHCTTIRSIKQQSNCGSCWAVSVASAFSDRLCIHSNGKINVNMSADELLACDKKSHACGGGNLHTAWQYIADEGLVTGGDYGSNEGCRPYSIPPQKSKFDGPPKPPQCEAKKKCTEKYKVQNGSIIFLHNTEYQIRKEIYENGPITAGYRVYLSFRLYKSGIYSKPWFDIMHLGGHAVRVIGWGEENGTKYWLVANSWGKEWGEEGTFRILRGTDECQFESNMVAGLPDSESL
ncbi:uncharacterized protein LOC135838755 [Planococcus citri]|uniref:uncharacterized protein LOC135838755 n=1 Tax=Planococcus citri TaxID=170843 RepID=UPI0031F8A282